MGYCAFNWVSFRVWWCCDQFLRFLTQSQPHLCVFSLLPFSSHWGSSCYAWLFLISVLSAELYRQALQSKYFWHFEFGFSVLSVCFQDAFRFGRVITVVYWLGLVHETSDHFFLSNYWELSPVVFWQPWAYRSIWELCSRFHQFWKRVQLPIYQNLRHFHGLN